MHNIYFVEIYIKNDHIFGWILCKLYETDIYLSAKICNIIQHLCIGYSWEREFVKSTCFQNQSCSYFLSCYWVLWTNQKLPLNGPTNVPGRKVSVWQKARYTSEKSKPNIHLNCQASAGSPVVNYRPSFFCNRK